MFYGVNYMEKIKVLAKNHRYFNSVLLEKYADRILQFRIVRNQPEIEFVEVEDLTDSDRNGFGSSGVR